MLQLLPSTTDDALLDNLSPADIFRYSRTNKSAHHTLQSYLRRRYKLSHILSRFFSEEQTEELRTLMSATDMIISGSVALQFLDRTVYPESDLDLYAPFKHAWHIPDWLVSAGYTYAPKKPTLPTVDIALRTAAARHRRGFTGNTPSMNRGYLKATSVLDFVAENPPRKVQLITTVRSTIEVILGFHSTCVMNFITHDKAYSIFPRATFEERRALTYLHPLYGSESEKSSYHKYIERGWELGGSVTRDEFDDPSSSFARGTRFIGDNQCWVLPVLPARDDLPPTNVEINSFALEYDEELQPVFTYRHLDLVGLRQPYVLLEEDADYVMSEEGMLELVRHRLPELDIEEENPVDDEDSDSVEEVDDEPADSDNDLPTPSGEPRIPDVMTFDNDLSRLITQLRQLDMAANDNF